MNDPATKSAVTTNCILNSRAVEINRRKGKLGGIPHALKTYLREQNRPFYALER